MSHSCESLDFQGFNGHPLPCYHYYMIENCTYRLQTDWKTKNLFTVDEISVLETQSVLTRVAGEVGDKELLDVLLVLNLL